MSSLLKLKENGIVEFVSNDDIDLDKIHIRFMPAWTLRLTLFMWDICLFW